MTDNTRLRHCIAATERHLLGAFRAYRRQAAAKANAKTPEELEAIERRSDVNAHYWAAFIAARGGRSLTDQMSGKPDCDTTDFDRMRRSIATAESYLLVAFRVYRQQAAAKADAKTPGELEAVERRTDANPHYWAAFVAARRARYLADHLLGKPGSDGGSAAA